MTSLTVSIIIGVFMGFGFGVGCALAVMYSIYTGGYRKAMGDSLLSGKSKRYLEYLPKVQAKVARQQANDSPQANKP